MKASVRLTRDLNGQILDIGGGGEGVIGGCYGAQVVASKPLDELDEAPGLTRADGRRALAIADERSTRYAFFSSCILRRIRGAGGIADAFRVLKPGGLLCVWEPPVEKADPFRIEILMTRRIPTIRPTGVYGGQTRLRFHAGPCQKAGFRL